MVEITDEMIRAAAEAISYPTVYMGGPSMGQKIQAKRFLEAIAPLIEAQARAAAIEEAAVEVERVGPTDGPLQIVTMGYANAIRALTLEPRSAPHREAS